MPIPIARIIPPNRENYPSRPRIENTIPLPVSTRTESPIQQRFAIQNEELPETNCGTMRMGERVQPSSPHVSHMAASSLHIYRHIKEGLPLFNPMHINEGVTMSIKEGGYHVHQGEGVTTL
jgi:hypothetical protein